MITKANRLSRLANITITHQHHSQSTLVLKATISIPSFKDGVFFDPIGSR